MSVLHYIVDSCIINIHKYQFRKLQARGYGKILNSWKIDRGLALLSCLTFTTYTNLIADSCIDGFGKVMNCLSAGPYCKAKEKTKSLVFIPRADVRAFAHVTQLEIKQSKSKS